MTAAIRTNQVVDDATVPVPVTGALVYVYNQDGSLASLTSDGTTAIANPLTTDAFGNYSYYALVGYYREDIWFNGAKRWIENNVAVGSPGADLTLRSDLALMTGSSLVGFIASGEGAVAQTLQSRARAGMVLITDYGGVGDCTALGVGTPNDAALAAATTALGGRGVILFPRGRYRYTEQPVRKDGISWLGEGWTENPGVVEGVIYTNVTAYDGTVFVFDADVPGPILYDITDTGTASVVVADIAANGNSSTYYKFPTARHAFTRDILFLGGGGTNIDAHGFESRTQFSVDNCGFIGFAGCGMKVIGSSDTGTVVYGNADGSSVSNVRLLANLMHGLHVEGRDANTIKFGRVHAANNGGCNIYEISLLGNNHTEFDLSTGNRSYGTSSPQRTQLLIDCPRLSDQTFGSIYATSDVGVHRFHGYIESGSGSVGYAILGYVTGQCADDTLWSTDTTALIEDGFGKIIRGSKLHINKLGSKTVGINFGLPTTNNDVLGWGSSDDDSGGTYRGWRLGNYNADSGGSWHLYYAGSLSETAIQLPTSVSTWNARGGISRFGPAFPNGYFQGGNGFSGTMYRGTGTAAPTTGAWSVGDTIWNTAPTASGNMGWVCVTAGSPGTWKTFGSIGA
jgi:hypothetical protein